MELGLEDKLDRETTRKWWLCSFLFAFQSLFYVKSTGWVYFILSVGLFWGEIYSTLWNKLPLWKLGHILIELNVLELDSF